MRILSIDGGGIRGIVPGQVLVALEKKLQTLSRNPDFKIGEAFDLIAGTSTGGILACVYLSPDPEKRGKARFSAKQAVDLYLQNGDDIFDVSILKKIESLGGLTDEKYSAEPLEKVLRSYLGDLKLSELLKPCLITAYDIAQRQAKFFDSADLTIKGLTEGRDFYVRDVARATSAAPTYFEPANITSLDRKVFPLVDGGVFANNPAMCALVEAFSLDKDRDMTVQELQVLSLGTGEADTSYHYSEAKNWGKIAWVQPVLDIMMSGVAETVDYQLKLLFKSVGVPQNYVRIQLDIEQYNRGHARKVDDAMDNASIDNMAALAEAGESLAQQHDADLDRFARSLLA